MEGGFLALIGLLVLAPFLMWAERAQRFRQLSLVEQNLQRASHGFTLAAFVLIAVFGMYGWSDVSLLVTNPAQALPGAIIFGGLFVYGFARFLAGVRRSAGVRDGLLAFRALLKLAVGLPGSWFFWRVGTAPGLALPVWGALLCLVGLVVSLWCVLTGAVRFVLTLGLHRRPKAPPLHPSPRGAARDASAAEAAAAMQRSGARKIPLDEQEVLIRMEAPTPIKIGYYYDSKNQKTGAPNLFAGERHLLIFGLNGAGKSTRFLIENLVKLRNRSIVVFDIKGELAAMTARTRREFSDVKIINPYGVVGLPSDGYNPLAILDPSNEAEFSDRAAMLADAIIEMEGKDPHWSESAQGLLQAGIMWEVQEAVREDRTASLARVRQLLTEADDFEGEGPKRVQTKGLTINAARMVVDGGEIIASLVGRFLREHGRNELSSIQSTFDTQTRFLLSPPLARDLEKDGVDFRQLRQKPTTVYIVLPPTEINRKRRWTRLLISAALCEHMRPGPVKTLFVLDEFRASVGHLQIISDVWSLVRGYGIQLMPVVQSATQLEKLFEREWENFAAQAGAVVTIGPPNDLMTANWMSEISGNETIWQDQRSSSESSNQQGGGVNYSDGLNYGQAERRFLLPQELRSMADGTGRIWTPGMGEASIPFFAPNWWHIDALKGRVDPNPYYQGDHDNAAANSPAVASRLLSAVASGSLRESVSAAVMAQITGVWSVENLKFSGRFVGVLAALWALWTVRASTLRDVHKVPDFAALVGVLIAIALILATVYFAAYGIVYGSLRLMHSIWPPLAGGAIALTILGVGLWLWHFGFI